MEKLLLSEVELSQATGIAQQTLRKWRCIGQGPRFVKVGRLARYRPQDVEAWLRGCASARPGAEVAGATR